MSDDLINRLRNPHIWTYEHGFEPHLKTVEEAAEEITTLRAERGRLREAMKLADLQYMGAGGNLRPEEVVTAMRRILQVALNEEL